jgi:RNA polymerase sigma-70 factor (ECF subfamily)
MRLAMPHSTTTEERKAWPSIVHDKRGGAMPGLVEQPGTTHLDAEVHSLVLAGREREAADLLLTRLSPELRPFLHRLLGDVALADEALSATAERLWRGLSRFRWECSLRSWSYIVARREASRCRMRRARAGAKQTTLSAAEGLSAPATTGRTVSTTRRDLLENLRASLSDEDRDLLVLRVERGLAWKEVAAAFLEEEEPGPEVIQREAARLRQRYRSIRAGLATALAERNAKNRESRRP